MKLIINENQLKSLTNEEFFADDLKSFKLKNISKGIKGFWRGEGYEYFSYLNSVLTILKSVEDNLQFLNKLENEINNLDNKIRKSKLSRNKKVSVRSFFTNIIEKYKELNSTVKASKKRLEEKID